MKKDVVIVSALRTPIGSFGGVFSKISATNLGAIAIKAVIENSKIDTNEIDEVFMGNVIQANNGQAPARQASIKAGIANTVPCTTVNKVCSSGMKAMILGAQSIITGDNDVVIAGGMENMSLIPHYLEKGRTGQKLGNLNLVDGLLKDGLLDAYTGKHMGESAELCADKYQFTRETQDEYAVESYKKSADAWSKGLFKNEIAPVEVPLTKGKTTIIDTDEEFTNVKFNKISLLKPVFKKEGTVTAANASTLNDGASALLLMSSEKAKELKLKPLAKIVSYADAANEPEWFTTAPAKAMKKAIDKTNLSIKDIDYIEINEAFSVVSLANINILNLNKDIVNVNGGAVSLGHPLGSSGSRIITTLINILIQKGAKYGLAGICNGGGGASAMIIERI
ncbi:MAG: thiolase family protein [Ichthyobacteriaceae bacterium]|nr:thiolase family protein [Ichthyobacteriaceae bacterium]